MSTSEEVNNAWNRGYTEGWKEVKSTIPTIPPRPGSFPSGVNAVNYYYKEGKSQCREDALKKMAGI
jgi:hypothetical protein